MSIEKLGDSDKRVIVLGENTTGISQVHVDNNEKSSGIAFSDNLDGTLSENSVIIQITNSKGVYAYIRAIIDLLSTWNLNDQTAYNHLKEISEELTKEMNN